MSGESKLNYKDTKGRIKVHRYLRHRGVVICIRQIDGDIFEYLCPINGEIYSSYIVMRPEKGRETLTSIQLYATIQIIVTAAMTTIDTVLKVKPNEAEMDLAKTFLGAAKALWDKKRGGAVAN
jgi:hypothetical protein